MAKKYALVVDGTVHAISTRKSDWPGDAFDVRDVSDVSGIAVGWVAKQDGSYSRPAPPSRDDLMTMIRRQRAPLLAFSDWTQMADNPLEDEKKKAWATYRQVLRDLPEKLPSSIAYFEDVEFPAQPE